MSQLVAEEMGFGQGWNSPSHTMVTVLPVQQFHLFQLSMRMPPCPDQHQVEQNAVLPNLTKARRLFQVDSAVD